MDVKQIRRENLRHLIKTLAGNNQSKFAELADMSPSHISQLLMDPSKKGARNVGDNVARQIEKAAGWPYGRLDHPLRVAEGEARYSGMELDEYADGDHLDPDQFTLLPEYSIEASAGQGFQNHAETEKHKVPFRRYTLEKSGIRAKDAIVIRVIGNSMSPVLFHRDAVGINTADTDPIVDGAGYALRDIDMVRIKLLYRQPGGGLLLRSYNREEFPDEKLSRADVEHRITILGRVFWSSRLWN